MKNSEDNPSWSNEKNDKLATKEAIRTNEPDWAKEPTKPLNWSNSPMFGNKDLTIESLTTSPINLSSAAKDAFMLPVDIAKFAVGGMLDTARSMAGIKGGHATENAKARGSRIAERLGNLTKTAVKLAAAPAVTVVSGFAAATTSISNSISNAYNAKKIKANPSLKKTDNPSFELFKKSFANTAKAAGVAAVALTGGIALAPTAIAAVAPAVAGPAITALSAAMAPAVSAGAGLVSTASAAVSTGIAAANAAIATGIGIVAGAPAATLSAITASTTSMAITGGAVAVGTGLAVKYPKAAAATVAAPFVAVGAVAATTLKAIDMAVAEPEKPKQQQAVAEPEKPKQQQAVAEPEKPKQQTADKVVNEERKFQADMDKAIQNSIETNNRENAARENEKAANKKPISFTIKDKDQAKEAPSNEQLQASKLKAPPTVEPNETSAKRAAKLMANRMRNETKVSSKAVIANSTGAGQNQSQGKGNGIG